jgi:hypothetical protein
LAKASADPKLKAWLESWWTEMSASQPITPPRRAELDALLADSPVTCLDLIAIGRSVKFFSGDEPAAVTFFAAAVPRGERELRDLPVGSASSRAILLALNGTKTLFWNVINGGDLRFVEPLNRLNLALVQWIPPGDKELAKVRESSLISAASCLYLAGDTEGAVAAAMQIDVGRMSEDQRANVGWVRGLALVAALRDADAIPELRLAADRPGFQHSQDAWPVLIQALGRAGQRDEAERRYAQYVERYHPPHAEMMTLSLAVQQAGAATGAAQ